MGFGKQQCDTEFAPAEKLDQSAIQAQTAGVSGMSNLQTLLDAVPTILMVLNEERQIVFANHALAKNVGISDLSKVYGLRVGEALECIHASERATGCGTTRFCSTCGAVRAMIDSRNGMAVIEECNILKRNFEALDLRVTAVPISVGDHEFTLFNVVDVSGEKRRRALERIFFHDMLNVAGGLRVAAQVLPNMQGEERRQMEIMLQRLTRRLVDEIQAQRDLVSAEAGELVAHLHNCEAAEVLEEVVEIFRHHQVSEKKSIQTKLPSGQIEIVSDRTLLGRVLGNMLKNALEASRPGSTIIAGLEKNEDTVIYYVHNRSSMREDVQLQVFQRSFSTKGQGRGLGTYSIKLLGERYLGGEVGFRSSEDDGTTFYIKLPLQAG